MVSETIAMVSETIAMVSETIAIGPGSIAMVSGDDLLTRVRRLLEPDVPANFSLRPRISGGFAMTVAMMLLLFAVTGAETGGSAANAVPGRARVCCRRDRESVP